MKDLVLLGLLLQTMMVKPREIFGKLENLCETRYNPLVVHDFNHFMREEAIWQRKHPELMCFLCEIPQQLLVRELIVGEEMNQQVEHREHFLDPLILEFELLIEPLFVFLKLLNDFFDESIVFFLRVRLEGLHQDTIGEEGFVRFKIGVEEREVQLALWEDQDEISNLLKFPVVLILALEVKLDSYILG
jgi:hypothetical protein